MSKQTSILYSQQRPRYIYKYAKRSMSTKRYPYNKNVDTDLYTIHESLGVVQSSDQTSSVYKRDECLQKRPVSTKEVLLKICQNKPLSTKNDPYTCQKETPLQICQNNPLNKICRQRPACTQRDAISQSRFFFDVSKETPLQMCPNRPLYTICQERPTSTKRVMITNIAHR